MNSKTYVVTGASSGIGLETARALVRDGASVITIDRDRPDEPLTHYVPADLADPESIEAAVSQLPASIDGLCNIAGLPGTMPAELVLRVNLLGARRLTEQLIPRIARGGCIVNMASGAGANWRDRLDDISELLDCASYDHALAWLRSHPRDDADGYPFAKEAMIVWTMRSAIQLRAAGIRVNSVSPGPVNTAMLPSFREAVGHELADRVINWAGRAAEPAEIADVVRFLCSDGARWVSGVDIPVDAGLSAADRIGTHAVQEELA